MIITHIPAYFEAQIMCDLYPHPSCCGLCVTANGDTKAQAIENAINDAIAEGFRRTGERWQCDYCQERESKRAAGQSGDERKKRTSKLVARAILAFARTCVHCDGVGGELVGPDGRPWTLDRIVPGTGNGKYTAENAALSCWLCNTMRGNGHPNMIIPSITDRESTHVDIGMPAT